MEFSKVELGPFLDTLEIMIREQDPGDADDFGCVISRFSDVEIWESGVLSPFRERYFEVNYYRFVLSMYVIYIKVDRRNSPDQFRELLVQPNSPLLIVSRNFYGGPEFRAFLDIVRKTEARQ